MSNGSAEIRVFEGAVAIITGGASGLGRAMAEELARLGCEVVLADRQVETAREVASGILAAGGRAEAVELDVRDHQSFETLIRRTRDRTGRLDYLFNNAGIGIIGEAFDMTIEDWNQLIDVNIRGVSNGTHAAYSVMLEQGFGHIVNTASMAGLVPMPLLAGYSMTKHAVVGLSISLRIEARTHGVRISALCPGFIRTAILTGGRYGKILPRVEPAGAVKSLERLIKPYDVARFAQEAIRAVARNRAIIIVPWYWRLAWWASRCSAGLTALVARRITAMSRREFASLVEASSVVSDSPADSLPSVATEGAE